MADVGWFRRSKGRCNEKNWCSLYSLEETVGWAGEGKEEYGETVDERGRGEGCGCDSAGLLNGFSSAVAALTAPVAFASGLVAVDSEAGVLSAFARPGCRTGFGAFAGTKCLPPPGFEEKKEE